MDTFIPLLGGVQLVQLFRKTIQSDHLLMLNIYILYERIPPQGHTEMHTHVPQNSCARIFTAASYVRGQT